MKVWNSLEDPKKTLSTFARDVGRAYWILLKIMVPAIIVVKLLQEVGATEWLGELLAPLMSLLGLPSEFGLVWAASILTNIYAGMVVFYQLADSGGYTVAQISTLGMLMLLAHALPIEGAVAKALGVPWRITLMLRLVGGFFFAWIIHLTTSLSSLAEQSSVVLWAPTPAENGWLPWLLSQLEMLVGILIILSSLMAFLRLLTRLGFDRFLNWLLTPLMRVLRVGKEASDVTIVGLMLGLSFGAGLLIDAAQKGEISARDMKVVTCFLGLSHSLIEDTLLILLLGAHWIPVLVGRLILSIALMALLVPLLFPPHEKSQTSG